ncbi:MAG: LUD domain-containing protein, partial [Erysipelotrichaceae bacterium]
NLEEAVKRVEETAAPLNCERLNKKAPCLISGRCVHCNFSETICSSYVVTRRSHVEHRIEVILIKDNLGY